MLDEPTVGLSMADVEKLVNVLHRLVDAGNTVVVIEHNLDVISRRPTGFLIWVPRVARKAASWWLKACPRVIVAARARSHTGQVLREFLARQETPAP